MEIFFQKNLTNSSKKAYICPKITTFTEMYNTKEKITQYNLTSLLQKEVSKWRPLVSRNTIHLALQDEGNEDISPTRQRIIDDAKRLILNYESRMNVAELQST